MERRARGDLIETFKIVNGFVNYGKDLFRHSTRGNNLLINLNSNTQNQLDFFSNRVVKYWNKLPASLKLVDHWEGVDGWHTLPMTLRQARFSNSFKSKLENFKLKNFTQKGHFWELSQEIFNRIDDSGRSNFADYMLEHPDVAKRRKINTRT